MLGAKAIARAKINLFLSVGARRDDGFHEIRSVMQSLELSDELYFRRTDVSRGRITLRCSNRQVPLDERNTVWRAVELFASRYGVMDGEGVEVFINKRVPVGAGLAGGSADAAAALVAMDHIFERELPREALLEMAEEVGSDVPFCLAGGTALVAGRGERISRLEPLPGYRVVLISTDEEVSTAEVYARFDKLPPAARPDAAAEDEALQLMLEGVEKRDFQAICGSLRNDLEPATTAIERVRELKEAVVETGAPGVLMTGSGPTVFALTQGLEEAAEVAWSLGQLAPVTIITGCCDKGAEIDV